MKAIITVDVPEHQIGQEVSVYFKDSMCVKSVCTPLTESDDCVSREEAIKAIDNVLSEYSIYFLFRDRCTEALMLLPSVQPKRDKGEWKILDEEANAYECSKCQDAFMLIDGNPENNNYNFCPNCGADMRGKK